MKEHRPDWVICALAIAALALASLAILETRLYMGIAVEATKLARENLDLAGGWRDQLYAERGRDFLDWRVREARVRVLQAHIRLRLPDVGKRYAESLAWALFDAAERHGVEARLLAAMCSLESAFRPEAVSDKDARGICQVLPSQWVSRIDFIQTEADLHHWWLGIQAGAFVLRHYQDDPICGRDISRLLSCYHGGPQSLTRPKVSTVRYVGEVTRRWHSFRAL